MKKVFIFSILILFFAGCSDKLEGQDEEIIIPSGQNGDTLKNSDIFSEHPRLLFRNSDLEVIRNNMKTTESANAVAQHNILLADDFDGIFSDNGASTANYEGKKLATIESKAFDYVLNGNADNGRKAIDAIKNVFNTVDFSGLSDVSRALGHVIFTASEVYDWCYPLLTKEEKESIITNCIALATQMEIGWPPVKQGAITSHAGEAQLMRDLLSFSIAVYDEKPEYYDGLIMKRYSSEFIEPRNYWYQSYTHHQGSAYGSYRLTWDAWGQWINYRLTGKKGLNDDLKLSAYNWIYLRRPDSQLFREGDDSFENRTRNVTWGVYDSKAKSRSNAHVCNALWLTGNFYKDGVLKNEASFYNPDNNTFVYENDTRTPVQFLVFNDPSVGLVPANTLPLVKYSPSPYGGMIARSGWENTPLSNNMVVFMKIGELSGGNHHHQDAGNFQIFYKGILASESGFYDGYGNDHQLNYQKATIAHNCLLIKDPSETFGPSKSSPQVNDGGQNLIQSEAETYTDWLGGAFDRGKVLAHQYSATNVQTDFAYIKGDLTKAYTRKTKKVSEVLRSMLFVPTGDKDVPGVFVVFDKITSSNAAFTKTFLLHSQEEPVSYSKTAYGIKNTKSGYNGMLVNQTLLPADAVTTKIGGTGKRWYVNGKDYVPKNFSSINESKSEIEFGWGRLEICPGASRTTDYFLNVMYARDADKDSGIKTTQLIETDLFAGTKILNNALVFAKTASPTVREFSFEIPGNESKLNVIVAGVEEGSWNISVEGKTEFTSEASSEGMLLHFSAPAGKYTFKRSTTAGIKTVKK